MSETTTQPGAETPPVDPEFVARMQAEAAAFRQQEQSRAAAGMPTRVARDIWGGIQEAPGQILRGGMEAIDAAAGGLRSLATATGIVSEEFAERNPATPVAPSVASPAETVTGGFINDVSQFAVGMVGATRLFRAAGWGAQATLGANAVRGAAAGAVADFSVFDAHEERLSNLIESNPALSNPITQYLAADPNDTEFEGRFKNAVEGLGLGAAMEGLLHGLRIMRARRQGDATGLERAAEEAEAAGVAPRDPVDVLAEDRARPSADVEVTVTGSREGEGSARPEAPEGGSGPEVQPTAPEGRPISPDESANAQQPGLGLEGGRGESPNGATGRVEENPTADPMAGGPAPRIIEVDEEGLRALVRQDITEKGFGQGRSISGIRTDLIENGEDIATMMNSLRVIYRDEFARQTGGGAEGVRSLETVRENADRLADVLGDDPDLFWQRMRSIHGTTSHLDAELLVYRDTIATIGDKLNKLADAVNDPLGTNLAGYPNRLELMNQFRRHWELYANVVSSYKGIQTNVARSLNAMRLHAKVDPALLKHGADAFFDGGEEAIRRMAARVQAAGGNNKALAQLTRGGWVRNSLGAVNEYWINSILSGVKTHAVNVASNVLTTALQPAERMIAGAVRIGTPAGRQEFTEGALQYAGLVQSVWDALKLSGRALRNGDSILDPGHLKTEQREFITPERFAGSDPVTPLLVQGLGTMIRLPTRFLMAEDEFFKQLNYRARLRAEGLREGLAQHGLDPRKVADASRKSLEGKFDALGRATDERHLQAAREVTFSQDLRTQTLTGGRSIGETLQSAAHNHPLLRFVLPFIRTPTNIARFTWDRTPALNMLRTQFRNDILGHNGAEARGAAMAKMATGGLMWAGAVSYALDGTLTGGGPADPTARKALMETGWRPYSIRRTDEDGNVQYLAYDRMDPFGTIFGIAADFAEVGGFLGEREFGQLGLDLTIALARQLQNKTYMSGLTRALGALAEPDRRGERFLYGLVGSFVPSILATTIRDDPHLREVRSVMDAVRARTPGYSQDVDPMRNILGEPVVAPPGWGPDWLSPIATNTHPGGQQPNTPEWRHTPQERVHDEIARQLVIHGAKLSPPPPSYGQLDLREFRSPVTGRSAYDRLQDLTGTVEVGGNTLRQTLDTLIRSDAYRNVATDGTFDDDGSRIDLIRQRIGAYRLAAQAELRREIPDLDRAMTQEDFRRATIKVNR